MSGVSNVGGTGGLDRFKSLEDLRRAVKDGIIEGRHVNIDGEKFTKAELKSKALELIKESGNWEINADKELLHQFKTDLKLLSSGGLLGKIQNAWMNRKINLSSKKLDKQANWVDDLAHISGKEGGLQAANIAVDNCNVVLVKHGEKKIHPQEVKATKERFIKELISQRVQHLGFNITNSSQLDKGHRTMILTSVGQMDAKIGDAVRDFLNNLENRFDMTKEKVDDRKIEAVLPELIVADQIVDINFPK